MGTYVHPWLCSTVALVACLNAAVAQEAVPAVAPTAVSEAAPRPRPTTLLPGLRIDLRRRVVEADARVVFDPQRAKAGPTPPDPLVPRAGGWLELVACTPGMREIYLADLNGTVVSLVNFGDDVVCRATPLTDRDDGQAFAANVALVPPLGTAVKLRFRAAPPRGTTRPGPSSRPSSAMRSGRPTRPPHETSPSAPE